MKTKEILQKAKDRLTPETWGKGPNIFARKLECAAMAIGEVSGEITYTTHFAAQKALAQAIKPGSNEFACGDIIIAYNDHPDTTLEMVHDKFDLAIASCPEE